jgi:hypothetical protein
MSAVSVGSDELPGTEAFLHSLCGVSFWDNASQPNVHFSAQIIIRATYVRRFELLTSSPTPFLLDILFCSRYLRPASACSNPSPSLLFGWVTNTAKMSFLGGAECSTAGNPLAQFAKVGQQDTSLQRDRLVGRGPGVQESMRSQHAGPQDGVGL